jgi:SAM-dependent MidA family methyltransferase
MSPSQSAPGKPSAVDTLSQLPVPDAQAQAHSEKLIAVIANEIEASGGRISFARYMELALFAPGLGYYSAGSRKFGEQGDFVTAPEISPLFSRALARQVAEVLSVLTDGEILEVGGGSGVMAADMLTELERLDALPTRYAILELSADLQARQRETLHERVPHLLERVVWLNELPARGFCGVVVANELLDALPVHLFHVGEKRVDERFVAWVDDRFQWQLAEPEGERLKQKLASIAQEYFVNEGAVDKAMVGYESEINLAADAWVASIAEMLGTGVVILLDYGFARHEYYHPQRATGTLMCHYRHRGHDDPFVYPGLQDITAHVDFTAIAESAADAGLDVCGYNTQGFFLLANGITELVDPAQDERQRILNAQQIRTLTMPGEMGELFKVITLSKNYNEPLQGFAMQDLRNRL